MVHIAISVGEVCLGRETRRAPPLGTKFPEKIGVMPIRDFRHDPAQRRLFWRNVRRPHDTLGKCAEEIERSARKIELGYRGPGLAG